MDLFENVDIDDILSLGEIKLYQKLSKNYPRWFWLLITMKY